MRGRVLAIGGSDSGGGAGIQADVKTLTALDCYAATAITAITVQDSRGLYAVHGIPEELVRAQIERALADPGADAVKTGMLWDADRVELVAEILGRHGSPTRALPLVVDPVMTATTGRDLLDMAALDALRSRLLPLAALVTPNVPEAERLAGLQIADRHGMHIAAQSILALGPAAVLVKGGHLSGPIACDLLATRQWQAVFKAPRIVTRHTHGTGCTLASAVAAGFAQGIGLREAIRRARAYVQAAIAAAPGFGAGAGPLNHAVTADPGQIFVEAYSPSALE